MFPSLLHGKSLLAERVTLKKKFKTQHTIHLSIPPSEENHNYSDWIFKTCYFDFPQQKEAKIIGVLTKTNFIKSKELLAMKQFKDLSF